MLAVFRRGWPAFALTFAVTPAFADPSDLGTAQALFDDGLKLMKEGKFADGCPKLAESYRLDPAGGTILVLGLCHEGEGRTATAWAEFNEAITQARVDRRKDRENAATDHLKAIEPKLTRVRIVVEPDSDLDGLEIKKNGAIVGKAQWRTALPVDPGDYTFEASAPGKIAWKQVVSVKGEGATVDVAIPRLADAPKSVVVAPPPVLTKEAPPGPRPSEQNPNLLWAGLAGGIGIVATGTAVYFGLRAKSRWNDAQTACPGNVCPSNAAHDVGDQARTSADLSTVLFIVGGAALAGGVVLYFTGESAKNAAVRVTPTVSRESAGLSIGGVL